MSETETQTSTKTRWKLTIEYDGGNFCGWQRQDGVPTVQQTVETAIRAFCQQDIVVHAAGRTDSGVHALAQVAHFDLDYGARDLSGFVLLKAINAHMRPAPVSITHAEIVAPDFHARFDAHNKLYRYRILQRPAFPALEKGRMWHIKRALDVDAMHEGAQYLVGKHDFTSFRDSQCQAKSPIRTMDQINVTKHVYDDYGGVEIRIEAQAQSFLHHQIRNIAGTLVMVGDGKWAPIDVQKALAQKDRAAAGPTSPPDGLYLVRIDYPSLGV